MEPASTEVATCCICLEALGPAVDLGLSCGCTAMHPHCLVGWLQSGKRTCPLCRHKPRRADDDDGYDSYDSAYDDFSEYDDVFDERFDFCEEHDIEYDHRIRTMTDQAWSAERDAHLALHDEAERAERAWKKRLADSAAARDAAVSNALWEARRIKKGQRVGKVVDTFREAKSRVAEAKREHKAAKKERKPVWQNANKAKKLIEKREQKKVDALDCVRRQAVKTSSEAEQKLRVQLLATHKKLDKKRAQRFGINSIAAHRAHDNRVKPCACGSLTCALITTTRHRYHGTKPTQLPRIVPNATHSPRAPDSTRRSARRGRARSRPRRRSRRRRTSLPRQRAGSRSRPRSRPSPPSPRRSVAGGAISRRGTASRGPSSTATVGRRWTLSATAAECTFSKTRPDSPRRASAGPSRR